MNTNMLCNWNMKINPKLGPNLSLSEFLQAPYRYLYLGKSLSDTPKPPISCRNTVNNLWKGTIDVGLSISNAEWHRAWKVHLAINFYKLIKVERVRARIKLWLNSLSLENCRSWEQPGDRCYVWWHAPGGGPSSLEAPPAAQSVWCYHLGTAPADVLSHPLEPEAVHNIQNDLSWNITQSRTSLSISLVPQRKPDMSLYVWDIAYRVFSIPVYSPPPTTMDREHRIPFPLSGSLPQLLWTENIESLFHLVDPS